MSTIATVVYTTSRQVLEYTLRSTRSLGCQINICCRPSNIDAPVMSVDWISLVEIEFEELIVSNALEVLVSMSNSQSQTFRCTGRA
jgi:hypothetical protein